jgi:hypothetical protein
MRVNVAVCVLALWLSLMPAAMPAENPAEAEAAALAWLTLVDAGSYAQSWSSASSVFRERVPQPQWESSVAGARTPLGALKSRKVASATAATSLPGAPDGHYVVIRYDSSFEHKANATETVTPMLDTDGKWRVSGYYIK